MQHALLQPRPFAVGFRPATSITTRPAPDARSYSVCTALLSNLELAAVTKGALDLWNRNSNGFGVEHATDVRDLCMVIAKLPHLPDEVVFQEAHDRGVLHLVVGHEAFRGERPSKRRVSVAFL